jgi:hypothetical protein
MFTQVLGILTSLLITSQSKERPFVLVHSQAIFTQSTAGHISSWVASVELLYHRAKIFLTEDVILPELLSDNLSNVPEDILSVVIEWEWQFCERKKNCAPNKTLQWKSKKLEESDDSNNTSNEGLTMWVKEYRRLI